MTTETNDLVEAARELLHAWYSGRSILPAIARIKAALAKLDAN